MLLMCQELQGSPPESPEAGVAGGFAGAIVFTHGSLTSGDALIHSASRLVCGTAENKLKRRLEKALTECWNCSLQ